MTSVIKSKKYGIEIKANFGQASDIIRWRDIGEEEWEGSMYQVADAQHSERKALRLIAEWLERDRG